MQRLAILLLLLSLPSCFVSRSAVNEPLDARLVATLEPGVTTASQVVERLGGPNDVIQLGRRTAYRYDAVLEKQAIFSVVVLTFRNVDQRQDRLWVFFDEDNVLMHYGATFETHHTQYAMNWEDIHEASDGRARDADRPGLEGGSRIGQ